MKGHKLVAPKGPISNDTWKSISRGHEDLEAIYANASTILNMETEENFKETDLYDEIITLRAVLRSSKHGLSPELLKDIFIERLLTCEFVNSCCSFYSRQSLNYYNVASEISQNSIVSLIVCEKIK